MILVCISGRFTIRRRYDSRGDEQSMQKRSRDCDRRDSPKSLALAERLINEVKMETV